MLLLRTFLSLLYVACACACADPNDAPLAQGDGGESASKPCPGGETLAISLVTDDGIRLIADLYPSNVPAGGPGVILLHMIPPSNSKANYPTSFAKALQARGFSVLNLNRRGAPGSGGNAAEAYNGSAGKLDAKAAYEYLATQCNIASYSIIGASNGTTTALDFAVYAAATPGVTPPRALVALSAGSYTENQNSVAAQASILPRRGFFAYPRAEAAWNEGIQAYVPGWTFSEFSPGSHGTGLFSSDPEIAEMIIRFLESL